MIGLRVRGARFRGLGFRVHSREFAVGFSVESSGFRV